MNNIANVQLEWLENLENLPHMNRNHSFNYKMYDEEQFTSRFKLTKDDIPEMLNTMQADILLFHEIQTYA